MKHQLFNPFLYFMIYMSCFSFCLATTSEEVIPAKTTGKKVDAQTMQRIYEEVKTPYKYGIVLQEEGQKVDCPSIYRYNKKWYMTYIAFDGTGYQTYLAESADLLHWNKLGRLLSFTNKGWDALQKAGYIALQDYTWGGSYTIESYDGKYWMSYIGGALKGYESDPLSIGMAWSKTLGKALEWNRFDKPVLNGQQPDARKWETLTLYKSNVIHDKNKSLDYPFVLFYNSKPKGGHERIGMAVSNNMVDWYRYGFDPVIDHGEGISGDPQITRIDDVWVMFYFGAFWRPKAFDTFACSYDLVHWTTWEGPDLIKPSESWDSTFAHKPWVIKHNGIVYHFYCAVGDQSRVIALATSKDLKHTN